MSGLYEMCDKLETYSMEELSKDRSKVNTKELGEVIDMLKDLAEVKKDKAEADYYYALIEAMENSQYGEDYDYRGRMGYSNNNRMGYNQGMMYEQQMQPDMMYYGGSNGNRGGNYRGGNSQGSRRGYSNVQGSNSGRGSSRYGYSHDEFMEAKEMYRGNDPESKQKRMELLDDYLEDLTDSAKELVNDMTPEEKQTWKVKLSKILNM